MNNKFKIQVMVIILLLAVIIAGNFIDFRDKPVPHNPMLYGNEPTSSGILAQAVQDTKFMTAVDSIYETKEYSDYICTENDLSMAKEYRLYTTNKEKLFEKLFDGKNFEKSILIPIKK